MAEYRGSWRSTAPKALQLYKISVSQAVSGIVGIIMCVVCTHMLCMNSDLLHENFAVNACMLFDMYLL